MTLDITTQEYRTKLAAAVPSFLLPVRSVDCDEEIGNPFVLMAMLQRYRERGSMSPLRSDNVGYVVERLIQSRPLFNATRQRRALRMLAIACETAARNELTEGEALRVLLEAIEFPQETARQLLDELSHSILIRTPGRISFQMRSYGEYLAAEELHDKPIDMEHELITTFDSDSITRGPYLAFPSTCLCRKANCKQCKILRN